MSHKKTESKCGVKIKPTINSPFPFLRKNRNGYEIGHLFPLFFYKKMNWKNTFALKVKAMELLPT